MRNTLLLSIISSVLILNISIVVAETTEGDDPIGDLIHQVMTERDPNYRSPAPTDSFRVWNGSGQSHQHCSRYIRQDGTYGPQGQMLIREITGHGHSSDRSSVFLGSTNIANIENVCRNYYGLNRDQRINFWVWAFMSISWVESKCFHPNQNIRPDDPNGISAGEFQLEEIWKEEAGENEQGETLYAGRYWRGRGCNAIQPRVDGLLMMNPDNNIPCAVQIMGTTVRNGGLYHPNQFWASMRRSDMGGAIINRMREFPACRN
ncbi:MAG: hypothetical protein MJK18_15880 [Bdellovibrionales bacterium]|nr:hypothetical protein [Bdellovibrionales bacterium]